MSLSRKRAQRRATMIGVVIGFIIIFTFVISLIAPDLGSRSSNNNIDFPTLTPFGTPAARHPRDRPHARSESSA